MVRTQIQLTEEQTQRLKEMAAIEGRSMAELIRRSVDAYLVAQGGVSREERKRRAIAASGRFRSGVTDLAEKWNYLVIFPQKPPRQGGGWMAFEPLITQVLEKTKQEYNVDAKRLYLTGLSMGGGGTWAYASKHPDLFAAIAPLCGGGDPSI